jgi:hypothetical protein
MVKLTNVSNPAAFGAEWVSDDGIRHQIVQARGTGRVYFGTKLADGTQWTQTSIDRAERFGFDPSGKSLKIFLSAADAFVNPTD